MNHYYRKLHADKADLAKLYGKDSTFSHGDGQAVRPALLAAAAAGRPAGYHVHAPVLLPGLPVC